MTLSELVSSLQAIAAACPNDDPEVTVKLRIVSMTINPKTMQSEPKSVFVVDTTALPDRIEIVG